MNEKQWLAMAEFFSGWMDKASVGCLLVGMFQTDHMFGGIIGATICCLTGLTLKIWSKR